MPEFNIRTQTVFEEVFEIDLAEGMKAEFLTKPISGILKSIVVESLESQVISRIGIFYNDLSIVEDLNIPQMRTYFPRVQPDTGNRREVFSYGTTEHVCYEDQLRIEAEGKFGDKIRVRVRYV